MKEYYNISIGNEEFEHKTILTGLSAEEVETFLHNQCEFVDCTTWCIDSNNEYVANCGLYTEQGMYTVQVVEVTLMPGDTTYIAKVLKY
jgi:hypothetical protein